MGQGPVWINIEYSFTKHVNLYKNGICLYVLWTLYMTFIYNCETSSLKGLSENPLLPGIALKWNISPYSPVATASPLAVMPLDHEPTTAVLGSRGFSKNLGKAPLSYVVHIFYKKNFSKVRLLHQSTRGWFSQLRLRYNKVPKDPAKDPI